jgi:two-component system response regulator YesN
LYGILIVDDNSLIRMGLVNMIEWDKLGAELVATAHDGQEALELCEEYQIQIVITDIRMPRKNGLYLLENINKRFPWIQTIVISAYDVFDYAKQAMQSRCLNYILKPIRSEELNSTIQMAIAEIRKQKENGLDDNLFSLYQQMQNMLPEIDDMCHIYIITGKNLPSIERIKDNCPQLQNEYIFAATMKDIMVYMLALKRKTASERITDIRKYFDRQHEILFAIETIEYSSESEVFKKAYDKCLRKAALQAFRIAEAVPTTGVVSGFGHIEQQTRVYWSIVNSEGMLHVLKSHLQYGTSDDLELLERNKSTIVEFLKFLIRLSTRRFDEICKLIADIDSQESVLLYTNVRQVLEEIKQLLTLMCGDEINAGNDIKKLAYQVKQVIDMNYALDINLESISSLLSYSTVYISKVFRREMGVNINKYLIEVRMRKAEELLIHTNKKIIKIAELVGYKDYINFTKQFKKIYGITPGTYRSNIKK